jgi:hypothetical protein
VKSQRVMRTFGSSTCTVPVAGARQRNGSFIRRRP